jgi:hypothetical protein
MTDFDDDVLVLSGAGVGGGSWMVSWFATDAGRRSART